VAQEGKKVPGRCGAKEVDAMRKMAKWIIVIVAVCGALAALVVFRWGGGRLKVSERAYYVSRIRRIVERWRETAKQAGRDKEGRIKQPYRSYLVIDTTEPAMWIESDSKISAENYTELPHNMKWKLYSSTPGGNEDLPRKVRLKIRGLNSSRLFPEMICVHSYRRACGHLSCYLTAGNVTTDYGDEDLAIQKYSGRSGRGNDGYESMLVDDDEWQQYREHLRSEGLVQRGGSVEDRLEWPVEANVARWFNFEKQLYQEIEKAILREGFELHSIGLGAGSDYLSAKGRIEVRERRGFLNDFFHGGGERPKLFIKADYVGNDTWYVKGIPDYQEMYWMGCEYPDVEFLVRSGGKVGRSEYKRLLEQARKEHRMDISIKPGWRAELASGVTVDLLGVRERGSAAKKWWGPDGSELEYEPYFAGGGHGSDDEKVVDIAVRINWPTGTSKSNVRISVSGPGSSGSGSWGRGGYHPPEEIMVNTYTFEKSCRRAGLKVSIKVGSGSFETVEFRNISLVRGEDAGFEIAAGE